MRVPGVSKAAFWLLVAAPGLYQLGLLGYTMARRFLYPYDLEWMEGGMLSHALRLAEGHSIYDPPSVEFIPFLYTPLYPALLAALGTVVELGYQLGRAVSVASMLAVVVLIALAVLREGVPRVRGLAAAALGAGLVAAAYPWVEGWYDLVRGDSLFLAAGLGGLVLLRAWARRGPARVAAVGALLALTFFIKQTGVLLVAAGGAALLVMSWRAVPAYVVAAGLVGGGGTLALYAATGGWFWTYVFAVHQQHHMHMPRFWKSFANIFLQFPIATGAVAAALVATAVLCIRDRRLPPHGGALLYWSWILACGALIGALGWATQWAHFNAYIPAITFLGVAAAMAIGAFPRLGALLALGIAVQLVLARWSPTPFIPTRQDREAGAALIQRIRELPGEVFVLSHPWYAHLAGKPTFTHRMGIMDMSYQGPGKKPLPPRAREIVGLGEGLRSGRFGAVILDDRYEPWEVPGLQAGYRPEAILERAPRVVTGAKTRPRTLWLPKRDEPAPAGTRVLYDFERPYAEDGFTIEGDAFGAAPVRPERPHIIYGARGETIASSATRGDPGTGTLLSPPFTIAGDTITLRVGGGDRPGTRVELRDAESGAPLRSASGRREVSLRLVEWDVRELRGRSVRLAIVDEETGQWGVIWVDDVREGGAP